ncbi:MAG TPA: hypothetical protein VK619_09695 [Pyrinomonadaceae bacterium]|nr:hypothetical protein [Pyrinomonadaceae bacterium]
MTKKMVFLLFVITCIGVLVFAENRISKSSGLPQQNNEVLVNNKTTAFQVISEVRNGDSIRLVLKNNYSKAITAFRVSGNSESQGVDVDFTSEGTFIAPGETYNYREAIGNLFPYLGTSSGQLNIKILAVVFDDGSGDGDATVVKHIKSRRRGVKIQLARILPLLQQIIDSPDSNTQAALERLKMQILALPTHPQNGESPDIMGGLIHGKNYILGEIQRLEGIERETGNINFRNELIKIKERYEREAARL